MGATNPVQFHEAWKTLCQCQDATRMEIMELKNHPFYAAVQYHPEYLSRPMRPSPPYLGLILAATGKLEAFIAKGCQVRENKAENESSEDEDEALSDLVKTTFAQGLSSKKREKRHETPSSRGSSMDSPRSGN